LLSGVPDVIDCSNPYSKEMSNGGTETTSGMESSQDLEPSRKSFQQMENLSMISGDDSLSDKVDQCSDVSVDSESELICQISKVQKSYKTLKKKEAAKEEAAKNYERYLKEMEINMSEIQHDEVNEDSILIESDSVSGIMSKMDIVQESYAILKICEQEAAEATRVYAECLRRVQHELTNMKTSGNYSQYLEPQQQRNTRPSAMVKSRSVDCLFHPDSMPQKKKNEFWRLKRNRPRRESENNLGRNTPRSESKNDKKNETWQRNTQSERKHDDKGRRQKDPIGTFFRNLFDNSDNEHIKLRDRKVN